MTTVTCDLTVSVDGFVAGPRQSLENPLGEGGEELHRWIFDPQGEDQAVIDAWQQAGVAPRELAPTQVIGSRDVTHIRYRLS
jgi:hypothetical protein